MNSLAGWDVYDTYLFDIDGTLLECRDAVHYGAFLRCLQEVAGRELTLEGVAVHGSTDRKILADTWLLNGLPEEMWRPKMADGLRAMAAHVEQERAQMRAHVLPGVREVLEQLRQRGRMLGVATGNIEAIGWIKLENCGLRDYFSFGGFSDACERREDVFRHARQQALERTGEAKTICVVGDTPADVRAAHANGMPVIAVASGIFEYEELLKEEPEWCVRSLTELLG